MVNRKRHCSLFLLSPFLSLVKALSYRHCLSYPLRDFKFSPRNYQKFFMCLFHRKTPLKSKTQRVGQQWCFCYRFGLYALFQGRFFLYLQAGRKNSKVRLQMLFVRLQQYKLYNNRKKGTARMQSRRYTKITVRRKKGDRNELLRNDQQCC